MQAEGKRKGPVLIAIKIEMILRAKRDETRLKRIKSTIEQAKTRNKNLLSTSQKVNN